MNLPISRRLLECCRYVQPGDRVADVGCDHGYLGIHLLCNGIADSVIASDARPLPLQSAVANSKKYGVAHKMTFFCCDGLAQVPHDFDVLVCAGMGADTIVSILQAAPWLCGGKYRMILQCQSKQPMLRRYLADSGWEIRQESILRDGRFLYTVMDVVWNPGTALDAGECYIPPCMRRSKEELLPAYFAQVVRQLQISVTGHGEKADPMWREALTQLEAYAQTPMLCEGETL